MACVVTALWHAKPDQADRVAAVVRFQPDRHAADPVRFLLENRERPFWRSVGEA